MKHKTKTVVNFCQGLKGKIRIAGDKSISHRSIILGSLAEGETSVDNFLLGEDCISTVNCFRKMGVNIEVNEKKAAVKINGVGKTGLKEPKEILDAGNSGTTMRLLMGVLAGQSFHSIMIGDNSLSNRPMRRVADPLRLMGAKIDGREKGNKAPLSLRGGELTGVSYKTPVASAQIKSALLLAGFNASGVTQITEPAESRNHSELMLKHFGAELEVANNTISINGKSKLYGRRFMVPGDISSAAFFLVAATIVPNSELTLKNVGINKTRTGILEVLKQMGANIELIIKENSGNEKIADIIVRSAQLRGTEISGDIIPRLIDEIPVLAVAAAVAEGETTIKDAAELKVKETDRLKATSLNLNKFGIHVEELSDGLIIKGTEKINRDVSLESFDDHRIAMAMIVAGLVNRGKTEVNNIDCINISFPDFLEQLQEVTT